MDLKAPLPKEFRETKERIEGTYQNEKAVRANPLDFDTELMQPVSEWDKSDREGTCGNGRRLLSSPSTRYKKRYDQIDWSK